MAKGKFVWYDLMTSDAKAAEAFYTDVVGWTAADSGLSDATYTILSAAGKPVAGLMPIPAEAKAKGARPGWHGYIGVADVDKSAQALKAGGGTLHRPPEDIAGVGRFAVVSDPQGAMFYLFTPKGMEEGPEVPMETPGHVGWRELMTSDLEAGFAFYADQYGFTKDTALDMGEMGTYQIFRSGGEPVGGMMKRPPQVPNSYWLFYFTVPTLDAAVDRVKAKGGEILFGPMEVPGGAWIIQGRDPQGAEFALVAPKR